jgi:hypothetical protein
VNDYTSLTRIRDEELSTLLALAQELHRLEESKVDYVIDTRKMSFNTTTEAGFDGVNQPGSWLTFDTDDHDGVGGGPLNEYAHGQVADRLKIPKRYYDRMLSDAPGLLDTNVQHWFHNEPESRMVRMLDGKVRAILSNRYRRLDNIDLMNRAILPELSKFGDDLKFHVGALTDDRLYIRAVLPSLSATIRHEPGNHTFLPHGGDVVQAGVQIRNSEVGNGKLEVAPFIWRLVCLNGLVRADLALGKYHVGRETEEAAYAIYRDDTIKADDNAFWLKVRDAVGEALSEVTFGQIVRDMQEAATGERIANPVAATEKLAKANSLTEDEGANILKFLVEGGDLSQWGAVNAVTSAAKDAETFERQAELEALGGALLATSGDEWAAIAR